MANPDSLRFFSYTDNSDVMTLLNDGNVGIDTTDPTEKLDVVGNIKASGNISGSSTSTGSFGEVVVGGMSINSMTQFSSSVATKFNSLDGDIIALSIALG